MVGRHLMADDRGAPGLCPGAPSHTGKRFGPVVACCSN